MRRSLHPPKSHRGHYWGRGSCMRLLRLSKLALYTWLFETLNIKRCNLQTIPVASEQFFFQRPLEELAEAYSRRHLPESDVTKDNVKAFSVLFCHNMFVAWEIKMISKLALEWIIQSAIVSHNFTQKAIFVIFFW